MIRESLEGCSLLFPRFIEIFKEPLRGSHFALLTLFRPPRLADFSIGELYHYFTNLSMCASLAELLLYLYAGVVSVRITTQARIIKIWAGGGTPVLYRFAISTGQVGRPARNALVAELAYAHGLGPCSRKGLGVRLSPKAQ